MAIKLVDIKISPYDDYLLWSMFLWGMVIRISDSNDGSPLEIDKKLLKTNNPQNQLTFDDNIVSNQACISSSNQTHGILSTSKNSS